MQITPEYYDKLKMYVDKLGKVLPANPEVVKEVQNYFKIDFPKDYIDFLLLSNGAEGMLGNSYVAIWPIEKLIDYNEGYAVNEFAPGLILFGSDGGLEAYAFDTRDENLPIVNVPFIGMDLKETIIIGKTFIDFLSFLFEYI